MNATCPMAMAPVHSSEHLITRAILSPNLITITFSVQELHIDARHTARFKTFASYNGRALNRTNLSRILFHMWLPYTGNIFLDLLPRFLPSLSTMKFRSVRISMSLTYLPFNTALFWNIQNSAKPFNLQVKTRKNNTGQK